MAVNVSRISLTHERLHFHDCSVRGVLYDLIKDTSIYWLLTGTGIIQICKVLLSENFFLAYPVCWFCCAVKIVVVVAE